MIRSWRDQAGQPFGCAQIDLESAQVAVVDADDPGAAGQGAHQFRQVMDLDQRRQAQVMGQLQHIRPVSSSSSSEQISRMAEAPNRRAS